LWSYPCADAVIVGFAEEPTGAGSAIVNRFSNLGTSHRNHGPNEWARGVVLATVATSVAHVFDLGLVEVGELVLVLAGEEWQGVGVVEDFP